VSVTAYQLSIKLVGFYEVQQRRNQAIEDYLDDILRWMQTFSIQTWDHEVLYADRSSKDGQLLIRPLLRKTKYTNTACGLILIFRVCFVETTHKAFHLDKGRFERS
jgi:hypothetical protein